MTGPMHDELWSLFRKRRTRMGDFKRYYPQICSGFNMIDRGILLTRSSKLLTKIIATSQPCSCPIFGLSRAELIIRR